MTIEEILNGRMQDLSVAIRKTTIKEPRNPLITCGNCKLKGVQSTKLSNKETRVRCKYCKAVRFVETKPFYKLTRAELEEAAATFGEADVETNLLLQLLTDVSGQDREMARLWHERLRQNLVDPNAKIDSFTWFLAGFQASKHKGPIPTV